MAEFKSYRVFSFPKMQPPKWIAAFLVIFTVLGALWPGQRQQPLKVFDQPFYIGIAHDLLTEGKFTNGYYFQTENFDRPRPAGMRFTPVYPALLAAAATLDPDFKKGLMCMVHSKGQDNTCPRRAPVMRFLQFVMLGIVYWLIWWMGGIISGKARVAWFSLGIALLTAPDIMRYVNYLMTEITALLLITATIAAALQGLNSPERRLRWLMCSGLLAGLTSLTRPAFFDLFLLSGAAVFFFILLKSKRRDLMGLMVFLLSGLIVVGPWIARNSIVMGSAALTQGYGAHVLNERIAFNEMTWFEYRLSFLCWLPDGNAMGASFFGPGACHRFQWNDYPDSFFSIGNGPLMQKSLTASGGWPFMFDYLIRTYIFPHPVKHVLVTISLALRGAYISRYWGLFLMPICFIFTCKALKRGDFRFLILSLPPWTMLAFAAAISVNQPRYNLMLIAPFSLSGALLIENLLIKRSKTNNQNNDVSIVSAKTL